MTYTLWHSPGGETLSPGEEGFSYLALSKENTGPKKITALKNIDSIVVVQVTAVPGYYGSSTFPGSFHGPHYWRSVKSRMKIGKYNSRNWQARIQRRVCISPSAGTKCNYILYDELHVWTNSMGSITILLSACLSESQRYVKNGNHRLVTAVARTLLTPDKKGICVCASFSCWTQLT